MKLFLLVLVFCVISIVSLSEEQKTIFNAIKNGNVKEVTRMAKLNLDERDAFKKTPLMCAADQGNFEIVKVIAEAGADINARDKCGFTVIEQLESIIRRTGEKKKQTEEQLKKQGLNEKEIEKLMMNSAPPNESAENIKNWQNILDYLKKLKESKEKK